MTSGDTSAKFLELENSASKLLDELERLRSESAHYSQAATTLESAENQMRELSTSLQSVATELQALLVGLRDIGMPVMLDKVTALEDEAENTRQGVDALLEYHSRGPLGRLFGKVRRPHAVTD